MGNPANNEIIESNRYEVFILHVYLKGRKKVGMKNLSLSYRSCSPQKSNHFSLARGKLIFPAKDCILELLISVCRSITSLSSGNIHFHLFPSHSVKHSVRMKRFPE